MKTVYLVDLDGVVVIPGSQTLLPGALEKLKKMAVGGEIWFFSCWAFSERDMLFLQSFGIPFGCLPKPFADRYVYIDDKLDVASCSTSI